MKEHMYIRVQLYLTVLASLFFLGSCIEIGPRSTQIDVDPDDDTPPDIEIVARESTYFDDGTPTPEPIDISRKIKVLGDPAGITVRAIDMESSIDLITISYYLSASCSATRSGVPSVITWRSDGIISSTFNPRNQPNPIPLLATSANLTRAGMFSAICNTDRPSTVPAGTTGKLETQPEGRYAVCACNRSDQPGNCNITNDKCTKISGEIIFQGPL